MRVPCLDCHEYFDKFAHSQVRCPNCQRLKINRESLARYHAAQRKKERHVKIKAYAEVTYPESVLPDLWTRADYDLYGKDLPSDAKVRFL